VPTERYARLEMQRPAIPWLQVCLAERSTGGIVQTCVPQIDRDCKACRDGAEKGGGTGEAAIKIESVPGIGGWGDGWMDGRDGKEELPLAK
jgi:hypothetical protein